MWPWRRRVPRRRRRHRVRAARRQTVSRVRTSPGHGPVPGSTVPVDSRPSGGVGQPWRSLVAGAGVHICNECVALAASITERASAARRNPACPSGSR
ncbi:ClpX C4-type zinc finger protein [Streptomyces sp. NPDC059456]|uniref:ClpX C4-type zinc finger protein n=1 Tax=Streptomyces sp. NPDC059456 TaxID=3346838 RepID=UPI003677BAA6